MSKHNNTTCPECGHTFSSPAPDKQAGGKARWAGTTAKQRSEAARAAVSARWAKKRAEATK